MLCPAPVPSREPPRSFTMTLAPSRARAKAYSRPRPPPAPVTTMTRSCTPGMGFLSFSGFIARLFSGRFGSVVATLEQPAYQLPRLLCIRGVDEAGHVGSGRLGQHRLAVAELLEAPAPVVGAHPRCTDAAERQPGRRHLEGQVVDQHAARRHLSDHPLTHRTRLGEQIRRQRLGSRVDETYCIVEGLDRDHWQDGTEDLVAHQRLVG